MKIKDLITLMLNEDGVTLETEVVFKNADEDELYPYSVFVSVEIEPDTGELIVYHSGNSEV